MTGGTKKPTTFLESALRVAPLERGEDSWAFLRFCDVLPEGAKSDYEFIRAHEISRGGNIGRHQALGPEVTGKIVLGILDRSTPKGRRPDPKGARAKAMWKVWEENNFKAPQWMPPWPNHSGNPTTQRDDFPEPPQEIGEVLSATTNVHEGHVDRDYLGSIAFGVVVGGLPAALLGFIAAQILDLPAVPFTTGCTSLGALVAGWVHSVRTTRPYVTWVGSEGLATTTNGILQVFRFERAVRIDRKLVDAVSNGRVIGQRADYTWLNAKNKIVHRARAVLPDDTSQLPETAAAHFVRAAEEAWRAFENRDRR